MWGEFWDKRAKRVKAKMDDAHIGDTVLDISSGTGALATPLANIAKHVTQAHLQLLSLTLRNMSLR